MICFALIVSTIAIIPLAFVLLLLGGLRLWGVTDLDVCGRTATGAGWDALARHASIFTFSPVGAAVAKFLVLRAGSDQEQNRNDHFGLTNELLS